jgi:glycosidase
MLEAYQRFMHDGPGRVSFFDNHDMNRFLFEAGNDTRRLKLAALCLLTLPLAPVIYYGTEIGMSQLIDKNDGGFGGDHVIREDMIWDTAEWDADLLTFFKESIALRHQNATLRRGEWRPYFVDVEKQVYGYLIRDKTAEMVVLFNLSDSAQEISLSGVNGIERLLSVNGEVSAVSSASGVKLAFPALGGVVLQVNMALR